MAIGISIRLYEGSVAKASVTGITALWWDSTTVYDFDTPIGKTNSASTDADGDLELDLSDVSGLAVDDWGYLLLRKEDVGDHKDSLIFSGRVQVTTVTGVTKLAYAGSAWIRPSTWSALSDVTGGNKFSGLYAVFPKGPNWCAFKFTCSGSTNYTVDWGDSTANSDIASASNAEHSYSYANCSDNDVGIADAEACTFTDTGDKINIAGHNYRDRDLVAFNSITTTTGISTATLYYVKNPTKAVTFTVATNKVNLSTHGYSNDETIEFDRIVTTTNISPNTTYYIVNAGTDDFQIASTQGGSAIDLTGSDGTGVLFKNDYFQVADTMGGSAKALTNNGSGTIYRAKYRLAVVDVVPTTGGGTFTGLNLNIRHTSATVNTAADYCTGWLDIELNAASMTTLDVIGSTGINCRHLMLERFSAGTLGAVTDFSYMFYYCYALQSVPELDTSSGTNFSYAFAHCYSLRSLTLLDTSSGTNFSYMFYYCYALPTIPLLDTSSGTNFSYMFQNCHALKSIPLLDTSKGTNFSYMFLSCYSLTTVPLLDTSLGDDFGYMFSSCYSLVTVPFLDTSKGWAFNYMFDDCTSLQTVPPLDVSSATTMDSMFYNCYSLQVGRLEGTPVTIAYAYCQLSGTELDDIYTGLKSGVTGKDIDVTGCYGAASDTPSIATNKGWTVTG